METNDAGLEATLNDELLSDVRYARLTGRTIATIISACHFAMQAQTDEGALSWMHDVKNLQEKAFTILGDMVKARMKQSPQLVDEAAGVVEAAPEQPQELANDHDIR